MFLERERHAPARRSSARALGNALEIFADCCRARARAGCVDLPTEAQVVAMKRRLRALDLCSQLGKYAASVLGVRADRKRQPDS